MSGISRDLWLQAVAAIEPESDPDAYTISDLMDLLGLKETATKDRVNKLVKIGAATMTRKRITDSTGRTQLVAAYKLLTKGGMHGADKKRHR